MNAYVFLCALLALSSSAQEIRSWTTTEDLRLKMHEERLAAGPAGPEARLIEINPARSFQEVLGIGASFEHSTCSNLFRVTPSERERAIERLVSPPPAGAGMNLMRICIGTSDFSGEDWYSYDDLPGSPPGQADPELRKFSIARDQAYILPVLKIAKQKNPELLFFASPWSPPGWMKTTGSMIGGELLPKYYAAYAQYFVRFIQAYQAEGIAIHAITVQNEPGVDRAQGDPKWHYPSCHWTAEQERDFIRDHLGPAFRQAGLTTKIWCYDHNYNTERKEDSDGLAHPRTILSDPRAAEFVQGVGFHHYEGQPSGMTVFHQEFPAKPIHFTEGSVFSIFGGHDLIERFRNWAVSYNAWVAILDEAGQPNKGPFPATIAILRLNSKTGRVEEILEYYNYAHFSAFVRRGARRIESTAGNADFNHIAFLNPDQSVISILVNTTAQPISAALKIKQRSIPLQLPPKSIRSCVISP